MGKDDWLPLCEYVEKTKKEYWEWDGITDEIIYETVINLGGPDSDSESNSDEEEGGDFEKDWRWSFWRGRNAVIQWIFMIS